PLRVSARPRLGDLVRGPRRATCAQGFPSELRIGTVGPNPVPRAGSACEPPDTPHEGEEERGVRRAREGPAQRHHSHPAGCPRGEGPWPGPPTRRPRGEGPWPGPPTRRPRGEGPRPWGVAGSTGQQRVRAHEAAEGRGRTRLGP